MKWQLYRSISSTFFFAFIVWLAIRNFRKDPTDNIALFGIIFFTAITSMVITRVVIKYMQEKKSRSFADGF